MKVKLFDGTFYQFTDVVSQAALIRAQLIGAKLGLKQFELMAPSLVDGNVHPAAIGRDDVCDYTNLYNDDETLITSQQDWEKAVHSLRLQVVSLDAMGYLATTLHDYAKERQHVAVFMDVEGGPREVYLLGHPQLDLQDDIIRHRLLGQWVNDGWEWKGGMLSTSGKPVVIIFAVDDVEAWNMVLNDSGLKK